MDIRPNVYLAESNNGEYRTLFIFKHDNENISEELKKFRILGNIKKCVDFVKNDVKKIKFEEAFNLTYFLLFFDDGLVGNKVHKTDNPLAASYNVEKFDFDITLIKVSYFAKRRSKQSFGKTHTDAVVIKDGEYYFKDTYLHSLRDKLIKYMLSEDML